MMKKYKQLNEYIMLSPIVNSVLYATQTATANKIIIKYLAQCHALNDAPNMDVNQFGLLYKSFQLFKSKNHPQCLYELWNFIESIRPFRRPHKKNMISVIRLRYFLIH